ncbi:MAG: LysE/ArgO family amino acid transporter, partial [Spirochaetota bacterium]
PVITVCASFGGAVYLSWFAFTSFRTAHKGENLKIEDGGKSITLKTAVLTTLALTFLNPHVYLDTVVMLGGFGATQPAGTRPFFGLGAVSASFAWFFSLAYSGKILAPVFRKELSWRVLDTGIGCVMIYIAVRLLQFGLSV